MRAGLKRRLLPAGRHPRTLQGGLLRGLRMQTDFAHDTQRWLGLQERELRPWFRRFSSGIASAVDAGAADGMYTLFFLARTPAERVLAFEPQADRRALLAGNLALNGLGEDRRLTLVPEPLGEGGLALDAFLDVLRPPCLIKADIEGGELALLRGAPRLLALPEARWIVETHSAALERDCAALLRERGYSVQVIPNAWWRLFLPEWRTPENRWLAAARR